MMPALSDITAWIESRKKEIISDLFGLVRIPSVSDPGSPVKPFGPACRDTLEQMYIFASRDGYASRDYAHTVGQVCFSENPGAPSVGVWCHLDVVPAPDPEHWVFPPFQGTLVEDRYLIGRGVQDNKMPAAAVLHVMNCLKQLGWKPKKSWSLYLGTSEENGMDDVRWFARHYPCPDLSLVPDTGFPVCVAQRGCQILRYSSPLPLPEGETLSFRCGTNVSVTPREVAACFSSGLALKASGHGYHVFKADDDNAVLHMLDKLAVACPSSAHALRSLARLLSSEEAMGIAFRDEGSGPLKARSTQIDWEHGNLTADVYGVLPVSCDPDKTLEKAQAAAREHGIECRRVSVRPPCFFRRDHPLVRVLTEVYRGVTGDPAEPFIMTGGNYAALLPNALGFGPGMPGREFPAHIFPQGHGDYHQCDESEDWEHIVKFMQVYAMAVLKLDSLDDRAFFGPEA